MNIYNYRKFAWLSIGFVSFYIQADDGDKFNPFNPIYTFARKQDTAKELDGANLLTVANRGFKRGITEAFSGTTARTASKLLDDVPDAFRRMGSSIMGLLYKLSFGSRGLSWNDLAIINNRIFTVVQPFIVKTHINNAKEIRSRDVLHEMDEEFVDENWAIQRQKIGKELTHAIATLTKVLPCYNLAFHNNQAGIRRVMAGWVNALSDQNKDQISYYIITAISDLSALRKYFEGFTSFKEAEQHMEYIKRWLTWTCGTLEIIAYLLEGDHVNPKAVGKIMFQKISGATIQATQNELGSLFGNGNPLSGLHI